MGGSDTGTVTAVYGTKGVADAANTPGGRAYANATWVDDSSRLWLYGGILYNSTGPGSWSYVGCGGDMWMWDINIGQWTWMQGTTQLTSPGVYGVKGVANATNRPPGKGVYSRFKDSEGNFYMFGGFNFSYGFNDMWKYDWHTNEFTWVAGTSVFNDPGSYGTQCVPGASNVPPSRYEDRWSWSDGCDNFWLFGGVSVNGGYNDLWHYNVQTTEFTWVSGSDTPNQTAVYGTKGVSDPANHPSARYGGESWRDNSGNLWIFGGAEIDMNTLAKNDVWRFVIDTACTSLNTCLPSAAAFSASDSALCEKFCIDFIDLSPNNPVSWQWTFEGGSPSSSTDQNPAAICYNTPGVFDVTLVATDANGESATITLPDFITVNPNPFAPIITQDGNLLTSTPGVTYQWYLDGILIPGATDQSYAITESGLYTVEVSNENDCKSQTSIQATFVGIDNVNDGFFVNVFGNPSSGEIFISGNNPESAEVQIQLMNSLGQVMIEKQERVFAGFHITMDVKDLSGGIYFLQFHTASHFVIRKIILVK